MSSRAGRFLVPAAVAHRILPTVGLLYSHFEQLMALPVLTLILQAFLGMARQMLKSQRGAPFGADCKVSH